MDFSNTGLLMSGLVFSAIGAGVFLYGKRAENIKCIGLGLVLSVYPYFVPSVLVVWLIGGACLAGVYASRRG